MSLIDSWGCMVCFPRTSPSTSPGRVADMSPRDNHPDKAPDISPYCTCLYRTRTPPLLEGLLSPSRPFIVTIDTQILTIVNKLSVFITFSYILQQLQYVIWGGAQHRCPGHGPCAETSEITGEIKSIKVHEYYLYKQVMHDFHKSFFPSECRNFLQSALYI